MVAGSAQRGPRRKIPPAGRWRDQSAAYITPHLPGGAALALRDVHDAAVMLPGDQGYVPALDVVKDPGKGVVNFASRTGEAGLLPGGARRLNPASDRKPGIGCQILGQHHGLVDGWSGPGPLPASSNEARGAARGRDPGPREAVPACYLKSQGLPPVPTACGRETLPLAGTFTRWPRSMALGAWRPPHPPAQNSTNPFPSASCPVLVAQAHCTPLQALPQFTYPSRLSPRSSLSQQGLGVLSKGPMPYGRAPTCPCIDYAALARWHFQPGSMHGGCLSGDRSPVPLWHYPDAQLQLRDISRLHPRLESSPDRAASKPAIQADTTSLMPSSTKIENPT